MLIYKSDTVSRDGNDNQTSYKLFSPSDCTVTVKSNLECYADITYYGKADIGLTTSFRIPKNKDGVLDTFIATDWEYDGRVTRITAMQYACHASRNRIVTLAPTTPKYKTLVNAANSSSEPQYKNSYYTNYGRNSYCEAPTFDMSSISDFEIFDGSVAYDVEYKGVMSMYDFLFNNKLKCYEEVVGTGGASDYIQYANIDFGELNKLKMYMIPLYNSIKINQYTEDATKLKDLISIGVIVEGSTETDTSNYASRMTATLKKNDNTYQRSDYELADSAKDRYTRRKFVEYKSEINNSPSDTQLFTYANEYAKNNGFNKLVSKNNVNIRNVPQDTMLNIGDYVMYLHDGDIFKEFVFEYEFDVVKEDYNRVVVGKNSKTLTYSISTSVQETQHAGSEFYSEKKTVIDYGTISAPVEAGKLKDYEIVFKERFGASPKVLVSLNSSSSSSKMALVECSAISITQKGFTIRMFNSDTTDRSPNVTWVAIL